MRRFLLGAAALMVLVAAAGCQWFSLPSNATDDSTVSGAITEVHLDSAAGDVTVLAGSGPVSVHRELHYHDNRPGPTTHVAGGTLVLSSCGDRCSVDYTVHVPAGTRVTGLVSAGTVSVTGLASVSVTTDSGDVRVSDVAGSVQANTTDGGITVSNVGGAVAANAYSGSLHITGVAGDLTAHAKYGSVVASGLRGGHTTAGSDSGDVAVTTDTSQDVDAETTYGNVELTVPAGDYRVSTSTVHGKVDSGVGDDPNGSHSLLARTTDGQVSVRAR